MQEKKRELARLQSELKASRDEISLKDQQIKDIKEELEQIKCQKEVLEKTVKDLEIEIGQLKLINQEDAKRLDQLQTQLTEKSSTINRLEVRVMELEPLTEAIEQEKLRRIKV